MDPVTEKILFEAEMTVSRVMSNQWVYMVLGVGAIAAVLTVMLLYMERLGRRRVRVFRERF